MAGQLLCIQERKGEFMEVNLHVHKMHRIGTLIEFFIYIIETARSDTAGGGGVGWGEGVVLRRRRRNRQVQIETLKRNRDRGCVRRKESGYLTLGYIPDQRTLSGRLA